MKLYSKPGACSTADHIALQWTGQPFEVELLTPQSMKEPAFLQVNPTGSVPALVDGDFEPLLREGSDATLVAWGGGGRRERAFLAAERLRASGIRFEMSWCDDSAASMRDAREGGQRWWTDLAGEEVIDLERGGSIGLGSWSKGRRAC